MRDAVRAPFWSLSLNLILVSAVMLLAVRQYAQPARRLPQDELLAMSLVFREIQESYVDPIDGAGLMQGAIAGMVHALGDEHSEYVAPAAADAFDEQTTGEYDGIGVLMIEDGQVPCVLFPFPDGPSARAGLQVGDRLVAVGDRPTDGFAAGKVLDEVRELLRGPSGSEVLLTIRRGTQRLDLRVQRGQVQRSSVKWARLIDAERRLGYIHIGGFQPRSVEEFDAAVAGLRKEAGGELGGLILDLRFNRGGLLKESVLLANRFLPRGDIVTLKRRETQIVERHEATPAECTMPDLPLVVLMNQFSASASEVVAGSLQDHGRARLVGTRSFGKGVVQSIYQWQGASFRLKLTTAHYYTPNGRNIEKDHRRAEDGDAIGGIPPDVEATVDEPLNERIGKGLTGTEVPLAYRDAARALCAELSKPFPEPLANGDDPQVEAATTELRRLLEASRDR